MRDKGKEIKLNASSRRTIECILDLQSSHSSGFNLIILLEGRRSKIL